MTIAKLEAVLHPARFTCLDRAVQAFLKLAPEGFAGARVLVTGARGYFGRYVVESLIRMNEVLPAKPCDVVALDSGLIGQELTWAEWRNLPNLTMMKHDVLHDAEFYGPRPTHIFHLAGIASPYWYERLPRETADVAVRGTRQMVQLAEAARAKLLFTSSSEVYQTASVVPTPEDYVGAIPSTTERSCYDVSKLMAETEAYVGATRFGVDASVLRIFNSFGPGMAQHDRRILTRIADCVKSGKALTVYRRTDVEALPTRTYTPVSNTLLGALLVMRRGESLQKNSTRGIYNVGLDSPEVSVPELAEMVRDDGFDLKTLHQNAPTNYASEPMRRCPDVTRIRALGWAPCMDLREGLHLFMAWSRDIYQ